MNENELAKQTARLARSEEKFLSTVRMWVEASDALRDYLKENRDHFSSHLHAFDKTEDLMRQQIDLLREISAGMQAVVKACGENNASISENTERMKDLLNKVESYFGTTTGLDYDN